MNINQELVAEIQCRQLLIKSEPDGIVRETMINNLLLDLPQSPTLKMIPVEELERLIINRDVWLESFDDHKKGMNALFDKLQEKINKYK